MRGHRRRGAGRLLSWGNDDCGQQIHHLLPARIWSNDALSLATMFPAFWGGRGNGRWRCMHARARFDYVLRRAGEVQRELMRHADRVGGGGDQGVATDIVELRQELLSANEQLKRRNKEAARVRCIIIPTHRLSTWLEERAS